MDRTEVMTIRPLTPERQKLVMCNYVQEVDINLTGLIYKFINSVHCVFMRMLLAGHFIVLLVILLYNKVIIHVYD